MRMKRQAGVAVFVAALLVVGGLIYSTFGRSAAVVADEATAAAEEEARPSSVIIAGVEYPVNEYGLSYGDAITVSAAVQAQVDKDMEGELELDDLLALAPDLVKAKTNEGEDGYITAEDYLRISEKDEATNVLTVYAADGTTEIGSNGHDESEGVQETKKYEDEQCVYTLVTYTYFDGSVTEEVYIQSKDDAPGIPISDIESGLWPLTIEQIKQLPEVEE